ncbi:hypothetical protein V6N12_019234 [Hibiscus sabdariffa]|uniref:RNase H type-1 domain-containing protein n=1 Tax=Hibiscus sabdariffa TaxID=183260 RepID=A0ABR2C8W2_9ROSI
MVPEQALWDLSRLSARLAAADVASIVEVPISSAWVDTLISGDHDSSLYTVRLGYLFLWRPASPLIPLHVCGRFWRNSLRSRKCSPSGGVVAGMPSLWSLASGTQACPLVLAPFVIVGLRTPFMLSATAQIRYWLFDKPVLLRPSSLQVRHRRRIGLTFLRLLSPRARWLCSSPSFGAFGGDKIRGCMSVRSTPCHWSSKVLFRSAMTMHPHPLPPRPSPPPLPPSMAPAPYRAVLGGFARPVPVSGPASSVEASALYADLEFATARGWTSACVESDAATLVNKIHHPTPDLYLLGLVKIMM